MNGDTLRLVYADESNNTGENLQDVDQPVFTVAGVHLDDDNANAIVEAVTRSTQKGSGEPKYSLLAKRPRGRALLMSAFAALPDHSVKVFVADKRFMTVSKIIDLGIEQVTFTEGYNMHADESARALAHMIALAGPVLGDGKKFAAVLDMFVALVLQRDANNADGYASAAEEYLATIDPSNVGPFRMAFFPSASWLPGLLKERANGLHLDTLDPAIPTVVAVCRAFFEIIGPLRLVHDHSKVIVRNKKLLLNMDSLPSVTNPDRTIVTAGIKAIEFGDSKKIAQLKIADWAAGAARDVAMSRLNPPRKVVSRELGDLVESWLAAPPLWPDQDWLSDRLGANNVNLE